MKYTQRPSEPIKNDAYHIADAMIRRQDQDTRLGQAFQRYGLMSEKVKTLSNDIARLDKLIQDRTNQWNQNYKDSQSWCKNWWQHLDGHPRYNSIQKILEVA